MNYTPLIASTIFAIAGIGGYAFMLHEIRAEIHTTGVTLEEIKMIEVRNDLARSQEVFLSGVEESVSFLRTRVFRDDTVVTALELLEEVGRESGGELIIGTVSSMLVPEWSHHELLRISFSFESDFEGVKEFIAHIDALPFARTLDEFSIEKTDSGEWFGTFSVSLVKEKGI